MRPGNRFSALAVGAMFLVSCNNPVAPLCAEPVTVSVTNGAQPTIEWSGSCTIDQVLVSVVLAPSAGGDQPQWLAKTNSGGRVSAPITYGRPPLGMENVLGPVSLVVGHSYDVQVYASGVAIGDGSFQH